MSNRFVQGFIFWFVAIGFCLGCFVLTFMVFSAATADVQFKPNLPCCGTFHKQQG